MKKFLKKSLSYLSPFIIVIILVICVDFFKVLGFHQNYYKNNFVGLNRTMITTKTYKQYRESEKFNAFIFGNSRSLSFNLNQWKKHLPPNMSTFHFDANGEGIWGILKKMDYISKMGDTIKEALIVIDEEALTVNSNRSKGHLYIEYPEVSGESEYEYYLEFLKASVNPKFILAYTDYSIFRTHRDYMGYMIHRRKYNDSVNPINCNFYWGYDKQLKEDSIGYYKIAFEKNIFFDRKLRSKTYTSPKITDLEKEQLIKIKDVLKQHNTRYKIIISPLYNQIPLNSNRLQLLQDFFGKENVYDFSGINKFTNSIGNFYESSHYKPMVANKLMEIAYKN